MPKRLRLWLKGVCVELLKSAWPAKFGNPGGLPTIVSAWVYEATIEASSYEPELSVDMLVPYLRRSSVPVGICSVGMAYSRLWRRLDHSAKHVFVLGDSDGPVSIALLRAIKKLALDGERKVLAIWTGLGTFQSFCNIENLEIVDLMEILGTDHLMPQVIALGRALIESGSPTIHIASSEVGWAMFRMIGVALSENSALFSELPEVGELCSRMGSTEAEQSVARGLPRCIRFVVASKDIAFWWTSHYGIDPLELGILLNNASEVGASVEGSSIHDFYAPFIGKVEYGRQ